MDRLRPLAVLCLSLAALALPAVPASAAGDVPQAVDDQLVVASGEIGTVKVLANDLGLGEGPFSLTITPDHAAWAGQVSAQSPAWSDEGYVSFVPHSTPVELQRQLTYTVTDADGDSDQGTISVTVLAYDAPVVAEDDGPYLVAPGEVFRLTPTWNDEAVNAPRTVAIESGPGHGTLVLDPDTELITYTPSPGYEGLDQLTYRLTDADGDTDTATVAWEVVDDEPVDTAVNVQVPKGETSFILLGNLSAGFRDCRGPGTCSAEVIEPAELGAVSIMSVAQVQYTAGRVPGEDTFTLRVTDRDGDTADAVVTVTITGAPDPGTGDDELAVEGRSSNWTDLLSITEQRAGLTVTGCPTSEHATITCEGPTMEYIHTDWWTGTEVLDYLRSDGVTETVTVTVTPRLLGKQFEFTPIPDRYIAGASYPFEFYFQANGGEMPTNEVLQVQTRRKGTSEWKTVRELTPTGRVQTFDLTMPTVHHELRLRHPASEWLGSFASKVVPLTAVPRLVGELSDRSGPGGQPITIDGQVGPVAAGQELLLQRWSPAANAYVTLRTKTYTSGTDSITPGRAFSFTVTPYTDRRTYYQVKAAAVPGRAARIISGVPLNYRPS